MTFAEQLQKKIEREAEQKYPLGTLSDFTKTHVMRVCFNNGSNILAPLLVDIYNEWECNESFHRLGGIDDCHPCKIKRKLEAFVKEGRDE